MKTSIASYQATQKNLPDGKTDVKEDPSAEDGNMSDSSASSSSSANSSYQTSYLSSMEVMKLRTKKEKKKLLKQKFRESNGEPVSHHDGEESVDDDNSPRKEKRIIYASTLLSEQVLSPISQSSAESTYSAVIDTESCADVELKSDIIPDEEVNIDICLKEEALDEKIEIVIVSTKEVVDEAYEPQVIFSEILSPKVSTRENSSSSFETTRTALKSPFKGMKKVAGRAFTFVSGGKYKKDKGKMLPKKKL